MFPIYFIHRAYTISLGIYSKVRRDMAPSSASWISYVPWYNEDCNLNVVEKIFCVWMDLNQIQIICFLWIKSKVFQLWQVMEKNCTGTEGVQGYNTLNLSNSEWQNNHRGSHRKELDQCAEKASMQWLLLKYAIIKITSLLIVTIIEYHCWCSIFMCLLLVSVMIV